MARRATSLKAMFCADRRAVLATTMQSPTRSGQVIAQLRACMPPSDPPITAAKRPMPKWSATRAWACTQSSTVSSGNDAPQGRPVAGSIVAGPVEPKHDPRLLTPMTKNRSVSTALPGPTMLSHQPIWSGRSASMPATWCEAFSAWQTSTALLRAAFNWP